MEKIRRKQSSHCEIELLSWLLLGKTAKNYKVPQSRKPGSWLRYKLSNTQIQGLEQVTS
jgi:hypothetical protein